MKNKLNEHINEAIKEFPLLKIYRFKNYVTLDGILISKSDMERLFLTKEEVEGDPSFPRIIARIPGNYREVGCQVIDVNKLIKWELLSPNHRHINNINIDNKLYDCLCTHLIEEVPEMENPILENLKTADVVFKEYKRFCLTGKFELKEYSHGKKGRLEYEEQKKYNRNNRYK